MDFMDPAEAFTETEGINRRRDGAPRRWFVVERRRLEESTMPRCWRDGIRGD